MLANACNACAPCATPWELLHRHQQAFLGYLGRLCGRSAARLVASSATCGFQVPLDCLAGGRLGPRLVEQPAQLSSRPRSPTWAIKLYLLSREGIRACPGGKSTSATRSGTVQTRHWQNVSLSTSVYHTQPLTNLGERHPFPTSLGRSLARLIFAYMHSRSRKRACAASCGFTLAARA